MRSPPRSSLLIVIALAALGGSAATAVAKVYVDPGGPAGKEYGIPLEGARGEAAGSEARGVPGQSERAPLFGAGIEPGGGGGDGTGASPGGDRSSAAAGTSGGAANTSGGPASGDVSLRALKDDSGGGGVPLLLLVVGILGVGTALGLGMRRLARPRSA